MLILCDVDDVVADFVPEWLNIYNDEHNDTLFKEDITDWDIGKFIKNQNNRKIFYNYLNKPYLYDNVKPLPQSWLGIQTLRNMGHQIIFVTSAVCYPYRKYDWLIQYKYISSKDEYIEIMNKNLIKGDLLIDDGFHNIEGFDGKTILFNQPWNKKEIWLNRANNWAEVIDIVTKLS